MNDFFGKQHARLIKLRTIVYSPQSLDFDRMKSYNTGAKGKGKMKVKEDHTSNRHKLTEEYALLSQWWDKAKYRLNSWEAELIDKYDTLPNSELLKWTHLELDKTWTMEQMKRNVYRIKIKMGAVNEKIKKKEKPDIAGFVMSRVKLDLF